MALQFLGDTSTTTANNINNSSIVNNNSTGLNGFSPTPSATTVAGSDGVRGECRLDATTTTVVSNGVSEGDISVNGSCKSPNNNVTDLTSMEKDHSDEEKQRLTQQPSSPTSEADQPKSSSRPTEESEEQVEQNPSSSTSSPSSASPESTSHSTSPSEKEPPSTTVGESALTATPSTSKGKMTSAKKTGPRGTRGIHHPSAQARSHTGGAATGATAPVPEFPLRIVVQSDMVGAIIGKSGSTIKEITQSSKARVDVLRKDATGTPDKVIAIYGTKEHCSAACLKIMQIVHEEAKNLNKNPEEFPLRLLAHNSLIGRIIGKSGGTIKRIMEETGTKISVQANMFDPLNYALPERVIVIRGDLENASKAEIEISTKLRTCYESDFGPFGLASPLMMAPPHLAMMPPLPPPSGPSSGGRGGEGHRGSYGHHPAATGYPGYPHTAPYVPIPSAAGLFHPSYAAYPGSPGQPLSPAGAVGSFFPPDTAKYTATIFVPGNAVGAIIGSGGQTIREMMNSSGAVIKVAQSPKEKDDRSERRVTVIGNQDAQWKAQVQIFKKVVIDLDRGGASSGEASPLKVEIYVPSTQVGRIIGKGGSTVRELQKLRKVQIKLPEPGDQAMAGEPETPVTITGDFYGCIVSN